jgi:pyruvate dehydrogenase E2 component (dihydrolipoamide acetyltransferase)
MIEIRLPQFGMGMTDGTIVRWFKAEGDHVAKGDLLCEIEAAKTNVEYESPVSGILRQILVPVERNVAVNTPIAVFETDEATAAQPTPSGPEDRDTATAATQTSHPNISATPLARRMAAQSGVDLAGVTGSGPNGRIRREDLASHTAAAPLQPGVQIEPRARKAARDHGVDLASVAGTGPGGRIVAEDVLARVAGAAPTSKPPAARPTTGDDPGYVEIKHSMMRRTIARRLTEAKQTVPHFYLKASCRIDALLAARHSINVEGQEKVSVNDLVIRAIAMALSEVPHANVVWDEKALRQYSHVDIAVAVATPRGLVTPVVRDVDTKTIRQIAAEVKEMAARGREGKLRPEEYQGGTTSVSNLGMYGVEEFAAIINPPHATIFAIGAGIQQVVPVDGRPGIATVMKVTISVDHRAVDGAVGAELLAAFKAIIEDPIRILA